MLSATDLKCEHLAAPRGLNTPAPRFTWAVEGDGRNRRQTAYQIVVGTDRDAVATGCGELWDSGRVETDETLLISYAGAPLASHLAVFWSVRVWDEAGAMSKFAEPAGFETGFLPPDAWRPQWIARPDFDVRIGRMAPTSTPYDNPYQARPADYFRARFAIDGLVARARLYASALGVHEPHLNGRVIGDEVLAPGWTDYHRRVEYQLYDVTEVLAQGENVLGFIVGEGWYCGRVGNTLKRQGAHYGPKQALACRLIVDYADGRREEVASDATWRASAGPIVYSDLLLGEKYDARLEIPGWDSAGFDDSTWWAVESVEPWPAAPELDAARSQPVRRTEELVARFLQKSPFGGHIFDLGQNIAGWVRLTLSAGAGDTYTIRHGEALAEDGSLYTENLRSAPATDIYVAREDARETFEPRFTFHGFRYFEVAGPDLDSARIEAIGLQVNSDTPPAGDFACGVDIVNQLVSNIRWSQRGNFLSVPTDCPQRDERLGWLADAQVFWPTASFNMDAAAFFTKWMRDIEDAQQDDGAFTDVAPSKAHGSQRPFPAKGAPGWGDGAIIMVWHHYCFYGDRDLVERTWPALERWMDYIARHNPSLVRENANNNNYGDWLTVGPVTPKPLIATAYWAYLADLMAQLAALIGKAERADRYAALRDSIRRAFADRFVGDGGRLEGDTQTAYLLALDFDLLDGEAAARARRHLRRAISQAGNRLATGFLGVRHLCPVLAEAGDADLAYALLLSEDYPSWLFAVRQGATTIWERWDGWTPDRGFQTPNMNSLNHYAYGAVGEFLFKRVAGIDCDPKLPGFRRVICRPLPHRSLRWAKASHRAHVGEIAAEWELDGERVRYRLTVPANVTARVVVPVISPEDVDLDGAPLREHAEVAALEEGDCAVMVDVGSGRWSFTWPRRDGQTVR
jgi:alpha-L-rhamnosidase